MMPIVVVKQHYLTHNGYSKSYSTVVSWDFITLGFFILASTKRLLVKWWALNKGVNARIYDSSYDGSYLHFQLVLEFDFIEFPS